MRLAIFVQQSFNKCLVILALFITPCSVNILNIYLWNLPVFILMVTGRLAFTNHGPVPYEYVYSSKQR